MDCPISIDSQVLLFSQSQNANFQDQLTATFNIVNHSANTYAIKIKTTNPNNYSVNPNIFTIDPEIRVQINVKTHNNIDLKDKFQLLYLHVNPDTDQRAIAQQFTANKGKEQSIMLQVEHQQKYSQILLDHSQNENESQSIINQFNSKQSEQIKSKIKEKLSNAPKSNTSLEKLDVDQISNQDQIEMLNYRKQLSINYEQSQTNDSFNKQTPLQDFNLEKQFEQQMNQVVNGNGNSSFQSEKQRNDSLPFTKGQQLRKDDAGQNKDISVFQEQGQNEGHIFILIGVVSFIIGFIFTH